MKKIRIKWWLHILLIFIFIAISIFYYYKIFLCSSLYESDGLIAHTYLTGLIVLIIIHTFWLLFVLVKLIYNKQFVTSVFVILLGVLNVILLKLNGFLWALTMGYGYL